MDNWEPKIIGFLCNWCTYAGADLAGTSRLKYPENIRIIRIPCSGRIDPALIITTLLQKQGVDGIFISGCHPGDCHYVSGNYYARRRFAIISRMLEFIGIEKERVKFFWISGSEGEKFAKEVSKMVDEIKKLGPFDKFKDE